MLLVWVCVCVCVWGGGGGGTPHPFILQKCVYEEKQFTQDRILWNPCNQTNFVRKETIYVDLNNSANWKIREPTCHFAGKVKHEDFIPLCQILLTSRNAATTCSPLLKLSITDWESLKRSSSVDLFCLKPD